MMAWIECTILISGGVWAFLTNLNLRNYYKATKRSLPTVNTFAFIQTLSVVGVLILHRSPLHLLWIFPISYIATFFTLRSKFLNFLPHLYGQIVYLTIPSNWRNS